MPSQPFNTPTPNPPAASSAVPPVQPHGAGRFLSKIVVLLLLLLGVGAVLEFFGVVNVVPAFGRGGRPQLTLGLWQSPNFSDVSPDFWARPYMEELVQRRIIVGFPNGEFRPEQSVSRAEFAMMLQQAFDLDATTAAPYTDVASDLWAAKAIASATDANYLSAVDGDRFNPDQPMTRLQVLVSLANGLNLTSESPPDQVLSAKYTDASLVPAESRAAVAAATEANLAIASSETMALNTDQPASRADVSAFLYQALVHQGKAGEIPPRLVTQP